VISTPVKKVEAPTHTAPVKVAVTPVKKTEAPVRKEPI
jgi:hypothetical protein